MAQTVLLGDEIELAYGKGLPQRSRIPGEFPVFGSNGQVDTHNESLLNGPGIIVGRKGSVGEVIWTNKDFWPIDTTYYVKLKNQDDNLKYWYYQLKTLGLNHLNSHSAIPGLNRDVAYAKPVIKRAPDEQKKIADILGTIDEKIELNRRMNETLEQMGQALFRHYFITNPEVEKWEEKNLGDILDLRGGLSYKASFLSDDKTDMPMVTMGCVSGKYRINLDAIKRYTGDYKEQHLLNPGDIFIATRDVTQDRVLIGSPAIIPETLGQAICATNLYKVVKKESVSTEFLYQLMRTSRYREQIVAHAKGSTIVMLTKDSVLNYKFRIDFSSKIYQKYVEKSEAIRRTIDHNSEQIQTLTTLRDTLLPRLISGKVKL